jgi:hypothetical protein
VDQDATLSRLRPEFESPWGHKTANEAVSFLRPESPWGMIFESPYGHKTADEADFFKAGVPIEGIIFESPEGAYNRTTIWWSLFFIYFHLRSKSIKVILRSCISN